MSLTWNDTEPPDIAKPGAAQMPRLVLRGLGIALVTYGLIPFVLLFNLVEKLLPLGMSKRVVRLWAHACLSLCGVRLRTVGTPMSGGGTVVANHVGWIDIFALRAANHVRMVSKAEVRGWPLIGLLSAQIGTIFIERRRSEARRQHDELLRVLRKGHKIAIFAEGTSTDGRRVLDFRSSLFASVMPEEGGAGRRVQPVSLVYHPGPGLPPNFFGWWGDMDFSAHLKSVLALSRGSVVEVVFHDPLDAADFEDRKALAARCTEIVRDGLESRLAD